jgi:ABC-type transport system substrate-binding protein
MNQPYPQLQYLMAMHFSTPIPREALDKYGMDAYGTYHPVGCGAYKFATYKPHEIVELVRNANCTETNPGTLPGDDPDVHFDPGAPLPGVDKLVFLGVREPLTAYNLFQQGYLDWMLANSLTVQQTPGAAALTPELRARGAKLQHNVFPGFDYIAFNMQDPLVGGYTPKKRKLRQAISLAINSEAYLNVISQGLGREAQFIMPPGLCGYDEKYVNPYRLYEPKLKRAKELLAEAGYPSGVDPKTHEKLSINLDLNATTATQRQIARMFQLQIEELGIHVETRLADYPLFIDRLSKHQHQVVFWGWLADYPDAENFAFLLYGPNKEPGPNTSLYANPQYDRLFEKIRSMRDSPEREKIIFQMRDIVVEDCPIVTLTYMETRLLTQPWIHNAVPHPITSDTYKYYTVDPAMRVEKQREWNHPKFWPIGLAVLGVAGLLAPAVSVGIRYRNRNVRRKGAKY